MSNELETAPVPSPETSQDWRATALQQFTARDPHRLLIKTAFADAAYTYATNGHIALRLPWIIGEPAAMQPPHSGMAELFIKADYAAKTGECVPFEPVTAPPHPVCGCDDCEGSGLVVDCETCDGNGDHECAHKGCQASHECGGCDGRGTIFAWKNTPGAYPCETCEGTGCVIDQRTVDLGGGITQRLHYLAKMQALPGPIAWIPRITPDVSAFRGHGWTVCIMHMRPSGVEHVKAHRFSLVKVRP
jgi:hypothetical protein